MAIVGICNKTADPSYRPVPEVKAMVAEAQKLADITDSDFLSGFTAEVLAVRGGEEVAADADLAARVDSACKQARSRIRPLVEAATSADTDAFQVAEANALSAAVDDLVTEMEAIRRQSEAEGADRYIKDFTRRTQKLSRLGQRLGSANANSGEDNRGQCRGPGGVRVGVR